MIKIQHKHTGQTFEIEYRTWETDFVAKNLHKIYRIIEWEEIVNVNQINSDGSRTFIYRMGKAHAIRMMKNSRKNYDIDDLPATNEGKKHKILEFVCLIGNQDSYTSDEIAIATGLQVSEVNILVRELIKDGDALSCTTKDVSQKKLECISKTSATEDAFNAKKYLNFGIEKETYPEQHNGSNDPKEKSSTNSVNQFEQFSTPEQEREPTIIQKFPLGLNENTFWTIFLAWSAGLFTFGLLLGQAKFDKEKSDFYQENRELHQANEELLDENKKLKETVNNLQDSINSMMPR